MSERFQCVFLDDYQRVAATLADWSRLANEVDFQFCHEHIEDEEALFGVLKEATFIVAMRERTRLSKSLIQRLPRLRMIVTSGMRNAAIDMAAARQAGVWVSGTDSSSHPPVELTWALLLGLARSITVENTSLREGGPWQSTLGVDLYGKTLGVLGLGKIGSQVAKIGNAFGMNVVAWSPNLTSERAEAQQAQWLCKESFFASSDFLTIHMVLSDRTRSLVGRTELHSMKPDAMLINTSRAGLVDQEALYEALINGRIAGAAIDVFEEEPLSANSRWREVPRLLATPHLGYVTQANYKVYFQQALENIESFLLGRELRRIDSPLH